MSPTGEAQPRALLETVLLPLLCSPQLNQGQAQLVVRVASEALPGPMHRELLLRLCSPGGSEAATQHTAPGAGAVGTTAAATFTALGIGSRQAAGAGWSEHHIMAAKGLLDLVARQQEGLGAEMAATLASAAAGACAGGTGAAAR